MRPIAAVLVLATMVSCTLGLGGGTAAVIGAHNSGESEDWGYAVPVLISAGIGAFIDMTLIYAMLHAPPRTPPPKPATVPAGSGSGVAP